VPSESRYNIHNYNLPEAFLKELRQLDPKRSWFALAVAWVSLVGLVLGMRHLVPKELFWTVYIPAIFLIASRYGALLQLIHEGAHSLLARNKKLSNFIGDWLCAKPIGINFKGYTYGHLRHHPYTNTEMDSAADTEKYKIVDVREPKLYLLFLKDFLGITAISIFLDYGKKSIDSRKASVKANPLREKLFNLSQLCFVQLIILGIIFQFQIADYILLWLIPAVSPHMFLMRIRGIAEHGLAKQIGIENIEDGSIGELNTRSFLTSKSSYKFLPLVWLEKLMIGSFSVHYHHEHHLLQTVPFYNLEKLHLRVRDEVYKKNPDVYAQGYVAAMMRNILVPESVKVQPTFTDA